LAKSSSEKKELAVWALTAQGAALAFSVARPLKADLFLPARFRGDYEAKYFETLKTSLRENFFNYSGHIVVAATGLVVRVIGPLLKDKKTDPAVAVMGHDGRFVISLLSGHLGRANELTRELAYLTGAQAVITTGTDLSQVPALEVLAADLGLKWTSLKNLPLISRTLSEGGVVKVFDPGDYLKPSLSPWPNLFEYLTEPPISKPHPERPQGAKSNSAKPQTAKPHPDKSQADKSHPDKSQADKSQADKSPSVAVDYHQRDFSPHCLVLRPPALAVGLGCHRDCPTKELQNLILEVLAAEKLDIESVAFLATIDTRGEKDLAPANLAKLWRIPLITYSPDQLSKVPTPNPSNSVLRRVGAASVCEASATLAARKGPLLIEKRKDKRATCAVALIDYQSLA
jgi:cobalt-precorrin 5A hydrolase